MSVITIEVNSVDVTEFWQREPQANWDDPLNGRGAGRIQFADVVGGFTPTDGQTIEIKEDGTIRFGGILVEPEQQERDGTGVIWYDCTTADYNILADRRIVGESWDAIDFETIVSGIVSNHMDGEGITIAGVQAGEAQSLTANLIFASEAFDALGVLQNRAWRIDETKDLEFKDRDQVAAPFDMDGDTMLLGSVKVRADRQLYRNQQTVRAGDAVFPIIATSGNLTEQAARAAIEGTSGIVEAIQDEPDIKNQDVAMEKAGDLLDRHDITGSIVNGETRLAGFRAGQEVNVHFPNHGITNTLMIIESVTAKVVSIGNNDDEIWYTLTAITGDPFGGWMEHYRKAPPQTVPLTFENTPGLFRVDPKPGVVVHDPEPNGLAFFQGAASGTLDSTPNAIGITHQTAGNGGAIVTVRRGPVVVPRQSIVETWPIDENELVATSADISFSFDEYDVSSHKGSLIISPDNTKCCFIERNGGGDPKFIVASIDGVTGFLGSVDAAGMVDNNTGSEAVWIGNYVYWPEGTSESIFVFDVTDPANPTLEDEFVTSATGTVSSCVGSADGNSLYCVENGGLQQFIALDITDPTAITEDDTQVNTGDYSSLGLDVNGTFGTPQLIAFERADGSNVRYGRLPVTGTTFGTLDEQLVALATSVNFEGWSVIYDTDTAIVVQKQAAGSTVNSQRAHVFGVDPVAGVTFTETLSYNHGGSGNIDQSRSTIGKRLAFWFGFNTDAEITFGEVQYNESVPLTIDCPLRVGFGGTGLAKFASGDLIYAGELLPTSTRGLGSLSRLAMDENKVLSSAGGFPAWVEPSALESSPPYLVSGERPLLADLDMGGFLFDNAPGLRGHIDGLETSTDTDADHDILINVGVCTDSLAGNDRVIELAAGITKQIDVAWAEGDDAGGFAPAGVVSGDLNYNMIIIHEDGDPANVDMMFDLDAGGANVPSGWVSARRIGSVFTDGSANILDYFQSGDFFRYDVPFREVQDSTITFTTWETVAIKVPPNTVANVSLFVRNNSDTIAQVFARPGAANDVIGSEYAWVGTTQGTSTNMDVGGQGFVLVDGSSQLDYAANGVGTENFVIVDTFGWFDRRGRDE